MIEVETRMISRWEIDPDKIFAIYEDEWREFMDGEIADDNDREDFIKQTLWEVVPHFEEFGGVEVYDDCEIEVTNL